MVGVSGGQAADLGAGSGVQQREQAGESFVRVARAACPSPEQRPLGGGVKDGAGEGPLAAQPEGRGWVDEDELAVFRPAEEAAQHVGPLVAVAGAVSEESFEVGGGDLGPGGDRPGGCEVDGQVAEDPEPGLQGDVAERVPSGSPGSFLFCELAAVEGSDRGGQAVWNGVEMTAPPGCGTALFLVSGQCRPRLVKNARRARPAVPVAGAQRSRSCCGLASGSALSSRPASRRMTIAPLGWWRAAAKAVSSSHQAGTGCSRAIAAE